MKLRTVVALSVAFLCLAAGSYLAYRNYWIHRYDDLIDGVASGYKLDPLLVHAVVYEESFFRPWASSRAGALGLMQVTAVVVDEWIAERGYERMGPEARARFRNARETAESDPEINLHIGCWYLSKMLARFSAEEDPLVVALSAYNAGATHTERWLKASKSPGGKSFVESIDYPETRSYVVGVRERFKRSRQ